MKEKIKEIFKKIISNGRWILILLFVLELFLNIFITPNTYDDEWFITQITDELNEETGEIIEHTIPDFVIDRYSNWSSRVIIEFVLCFSLKTSKYLWILVQSLMAVLVCYSLSKIFVKENKDKNNFMLMAMVLIYPYYTMHQTGWASTSINYLWPLAMGLFALIPIRKIWNGEKIKWWQYPLYMIALIFAANQEQAGALLLGFYLAFTIIMLFRKDKKAKVFMSVQTILAILSMVFILTCPGNAIRQTEELYRFKGYEMLSFIEKFVLGFTSTFGNIISKQNPAYVLLTSLITLYVFLNYKEKLYRVVAIIPLLSVLLLGPFLPILDGMFPYLSVFEELVTKHDVLLTVENCNNIYNAFPIIFAFGNFICIGMSLLLIFKNLKNNVAILIFLAGLASRIVIAFSPTVFVSRTRTMIFFDFSMIAISYIIWEKISSKIENEKQEKIMNIANTVIKFAGVIQFINCVIYIYSKQKMY